MIDLLFHGAVLLDSHPTDKSEDTLESGHQVRTWSSDSGGVLHFCEGNPLWKHRESSEMKTRWQRGKVIGALACYCLGKMPCPLKAG